jgi:hypothetical protein
VACARRLPVTKPGAALFKKKVCSDAGSCRQSARSFFVVRRYVLSGSPQSTEPLVYEVAPRS